MSVRRLAAAVAATTALLVASNVSAAPDKAAMQMIPGDSAMVISFDLARLRKAPLYKSMEGMLSNQPDFKAGIAEVKSKTGVDLQKDIDSLTIAIPADVAKSEAVVIIAKGRIDQGKLTAAAMKAPEAKAKEGSHNGVKLVSVDGGKGSFAFVNGYLVAGATPGVQKAIDASKGKGKLAGALSSAISKVDTGKDMWMAVSITDEMRKNMPPDPMTKALTGVRASLDLAKGLGLKLDMSTTDAAQAKKIADQISTQIKASSQGAPPMFANMIKSITTKASGTDVNISVTMSQQEVDMLKNMLMMFGGAAKGGPEPAKMPK